MITFIRRFLANFLGIIFIMTNHLLYGFLWNFLVLPLGKLDQSSGKVSYYGMTQWHYMMISKFSRLRLSVPCSEWTQHYIGCQRVALGQYSSLQRNMHHTAAGAPEGSSVKGLGVTAVRSRMWLCMTAKWTWRHDSRGSKRMWQSRGWR